MISDPELDQWSELWRSDNAVRAGIAERARKAVRRFRLWICLELLVTVITGGGVTIWAMRAHQPPITFLAIWTWFSLAIAWIFRLINDWNDFTGVAVATGSFLATLLRRLRSNRRAADFGGVLFFVQLAVTSTWVFRELNRHGHISLHEYLLLPPNIVFETGTVMFVVWLIRYRRRLLREIVELERMRLELDDDSVTSVPERPASKKPLLNWEPLFDDILGRLGKSRKKKLRVW